MIEINSLNDLPKIFFKELSEFKYILSIYNEIKSEITYIKSLVEIESKSFEGLSKGILIQTKNFNTEIANVEDVTNLILIEKYLVGVFESISVDQMSSGVSLIANKNFVEISDEIGDYTKGLLEKLNSLIKELSNARAKYKANYAKIEKNYKELEQIFGSKRKLEYDDKNAYNQTMKEKLNDKILNILNEFGENKINLVSSFDECKRLENNFNELIKNSFVNVIKFLHSSINHFRNTLEEIAENRITITKKQKESVSGTIEKMRRTELILENQELNYNNLKGINTEFEYLIPIINSKHEVVNTDTENNTSQSQPILIDEFFNKMNFQTSPITDHILSYIYTFNQILGLRKKQFILFNKVLGEIIKNKENFISLSNKLIKNLSQPKVNIISNCPFLLQICDFLRSLSELVIRKYEELSKFAVSNFINQIEHNILKDQNSDEVILNQIFSKLQKEYNNYKNSLSKIISQKEKVTQNIEKIKENIMKTSDDPNNFAKYEKQFFALRIEEGNLNENCLECFKKYKKFLEEILEILRKTVVSCREKESLKSTEFRENLILFLKLKEKNMNQILEFMDFRSQILSDDNKAFQSIKVICLNFVNDFDLKLELNEQNLENLVKELLNNPKESNNKEIQSILATTIFLSKDEIIQNKEFNLNEIINNEELKMYYDKLEFLKQNSKKISIRNANIDRKMYDDIFYLDSDEIVISNFACALSDKILLQGKLHVTNKKVVFYSWFNNTTLFGKTLIEIPKEEIVDIEKYKNAFFDNMIIIKTKNTQFLFTSFINRDKTYNLLREIFFSEPNPQSLPTSAEKQNKSLSPIFTSRNNDLESESNNLNFNELINQNQNLEINDQSSIMLNDNIARTEKSKSETVSPKANKLDEIEFDEIKQRTKSDHQISLKCDLNLEEYKPLNVENEIGNVNLSQNTADFNEIIDKKEFYKKLEDFNNQRLENYFKQNSINFETCIVNKLSFGDIPLCEIYKNIFDPDTICQEKEKDKKF